jgi:hypothetical protein
MKTFKFKLIISILAFGIGIACFYLWNLRRLNSRPQADSKIQAHPISQSEIAIAETSKPDAVNISPQGPISKIDFRNFTYPNLGSKGRIRVKDGEIEYEVDHCLQGCWIKGVDYLDFTGDGEDEAIVRLVDHMACGSSWAAIYYYIYSVRNGRPHLLWRFATGSETHGGHKDFRIEGKELVFELYGKWENIGGELTFKENREFADDCCPTHFTIYRVMWDEMKFRQKSIEVLPFTGKSIY